MTKLQSALAMGRDLDQRLLELAGRADSAGFASAAEHLVYLASRLGPLGGRSAAA